MKNARPLMLILLAAVGLTIGVYYFTKVGNKGHKPVPTTKILVATRQISYAERLVLPHQGPEGEKVEGNVDWRDWPVNLLPEGHIKDEAKVNDQPVVTQVMLTKGMPVLEGQLLLKDELKPPEMVLIQMRADRALIRLRDLRPGVKVDITYLSAQDQFDIMRCVEVYAIGGVGDITEEGLPAKVDAATADSVLLLIPQQYYQTMRQFKLRYGANLEAVLSDSECPEGPIMVLQEDEEGPDLDVALRAMDAQKKRTEQIAQARALAEQGEYIAAVNALSEGAGLEAARLVQQWEEKAAEAIYEQAKAAFDTGNLKQAEDILEQMEKLRPPYARAHELRESIAKVRAGQNRQEQYEELVDGLTRAIENGDFPKARENLTLLEEYVQEGFDPGADLPAPTNAVQEGEQALKDALSEFDLERKLLAAHLERNRCDRARDKLNEIKAAFPEHPDIKKFEQDVVKCERGE